MSGGMMIIFLLGVDDKGHYTGKTRGYDITQSITGAWINLCKQGVISKVGTLYITESYRIHVMFGVSCILPLSWFYRPYP